MKTNAILIHPKDNVAVVTASMDAGHKIVWAGGELTAQGNVPKSHKAAVMPIKKGSPILRYGEKIGLAKCDIAPGDWVHTHNIESEEV